MIFFFGIRAKIRLLRGFAEVCAHCGTTEHVLAVIQRYFALMFVPTIPLTKRAVVHCAHCKLVREERDFGVSAHAAYDAARADLGTPWWMFSGLVLIAALVVGGVYLDRQDQGRTAAYHAAPRGGDVVIFGRDKRVLVLKVDRLVGDAVYLYLGNYEYESANAARKYLERRASDPEYFARETSLISNDEYQHLPVLRIIRSAP